MNTSERRIVFPILFINNIKKPIIINDTTPYYYVIVNGGVVHVFNKFVIVNTIISLLPDLLYDDVMNMVEEYFDHVIKKQKTYKNKYLNITIKHKIVIY
jgi:hypothetical protein